MQSLVNQDVTANKTAAFIVGNAPEETNARWPSCGEATWPAGKIKPTPTAD